MCGLNAIMVTAKE